MRVLSEEELLIAVEKARSLFTRKGEFFITNVIINLDNPPPGGLDGIRQKAESAFDDVVIRFDNDYVVHPMGAIFDGRNYARWEGFPNGIAYAVYAKPKELAGIRDSHGPNESKNYL